MELPGVATSHDVGISPVSNVGTGGPVELIARQLICASNPSAVYCITHFTGCDRLMLKNAFFGMIKQVWETGISLYDLFHFTLFFIFLL